jgi:hypothetical protein
MYLPRPRVKELFAGIADRFPGCDLVFDSIPRWFSRLTLRGLNQTAQYRLPAMPWGINRDEVEPTLRRWHPNVATVAFLSYRTPRGLPRLLAGLTDRIPFARHAVPSLVQVTIANAGGQSTRARPLFSERTLELDHDEKRLYFRIPRKPTMTPVTTDESAVPALGGFLAAAARNATCGGEIAVATGQVVARRVALGVAATFNPLQADRAEFSRMVPEKVEAFSSAGMVMLEQSGQTNRHIMRSASDEVMTTARATIEMTGCSNPAALMAAQGRFARAWFARAAANWIALGIRTFEAQSEAMAPIRRTVVANAERLGF